MGIDDGDDWNKIKKQRGDIPLWRSRLGSKRAAAELLTS
jgi:hypothetical protein